MTIIGFMILFAGFYIGWNLGANDGANSMGTAVGAKVRTVREAVILVSVFGFLGAVLFGDRVIKTVGRGIVPLDQLDQHQATLIALAAMLAAGTWLLVATYLRLPVSTSHSTVGAVAGAGVAAGNVPVDWSRLLDVVIAWLATPIGAAALSFTLYQILRVIINRYPPRSEKLFPGLLTLSGIYVAFTWGANDVANATGMIVGAGLMEPGPAAVFGGIAIAIGIATWGYRIMETVGTRITHLAPAMAFIAELSSALNVQLYTLLGIPVSTTHSIIGAVFGVGLVHGRAAISTETIRDILLAWMATPLGAGLLSAVIFWGLRAVF